MTSESTCPCADLRSFEDVMAAEAGLSPACRCDESCSGGPAASGEIPLPLGLLALADALRRGVPCAVTDGSASSGAHPPEAAEVLERVAADYEADGDIEGAEQARAMVALMRSRVAGDRAAARPIRLRGVAAIGSQFEDWRNGVRELCCRSQFVSSGPVSGVPVGVRELVGPFGMVSTVERWAFVITLGSGARTVRVGPVEGEVMSAPRLTR